MSTERQKAAARENAAHARGVRSERAHGKSTPGRSDGLGTAERNPNHTAGGEFAFPEQRKEPITDARHVRNAIARFDQVEGVSDADRDAAWRRILTAARKFGVEGSEGGWRELMRD